MNIARKNINIVGRCEDIKQSSNYFDKLSQIKNQLYINSNRNLSLCGKILITNTFGNSKVMH